MTHGYGPRYLHSTGQLHKGGPNTGLFLQVVDDPGEELPIPGKPFGFRRLIRAQAKGDYESLKTRGRRVARIDWEESAMQLGMVGLGRMGANMTERLHGAGHDLKTYDPNVDSTAIVARGARSAARRAARRLADGAGRPSSTRSSPSSSHTSPSGDTIIDGGNSYYVDDLRRQAELRDKKIHYVDGGSERRRVGPRTRLLPDGRRRRRGGRAARPGLRGAGARRRQRRPNSGRKGKPAPEEKGWLHCGPPGAGHFVKMVHNGIEYGLMQAYAEGLNVLKHANVGLVRARPGRRDDAAPQPRPLQIRARHRRDRGVWRRGSVISSWLLDLGAEALHSSPNLDAYAGHVSDSGEGRWTVMAAVEEGVPVPVLSASLFNRFASRGEADWGDRVLSAMRKAFGGHGEKPRRRGDSRTRSPTAFRSETARSLRLSSSSARRAT